MLPTEISTPEGEAAFGRQLVRLSIVWILGTVAIGILLVLAAPVLLGVFRGLPI